jgi:serine/threonine protein kinase
MRTVLTASIFDMTIDGQSSLSSIFITFQVNEESKTFEYPFCDMSIKLNEIPLHEALYITLFTQVQEIGQAQVSLEALQETNHIEKTLLVIQTQAFIDPNKQKIGQNKKINVGRFKIVLKITHEPDLKEIPDDFVQDDLEYIKNTFDSILKVVGNAWKIENPNDPSIEYIGLALFEAKEDRKLLSDQDIQDFRVILLGLNEKLKVLSLVQSRLYKLQEIYMNQFKVNESLQEVIRNLRESIEKNAADHESRINSFETYTKTLESTIETLKAKLHTNEKVLKEYEVHISTLQSQNQLQRDLESSLSHHKSLVSSLKSEVFEIEASRKSIIDLYKQSISETDTLKKTISSNTSKLISENTEIKNTLLHISEKSHLQESIIEKQKSEILNLNSSIQYLSKQIIAYGDIENRLETIEKKYGSLNEKLQDCMMESSKIVCNFNSAKNLTTEEKENLLIHARELQQENMKLQNTILKQNSECNKVVMDKEQLSIRIVSLEGLLVLGQDTTDLYEAVVKSDEKTQALEKNVYAELDFMSEYLIGQSEHNLRNVRILNKIKAIADDKDSEIALLRDMVTDLQRKRALYIPIKDDIIDGAVADYINTRTSEVPFTREEHGIYLFGSKRVFIRLEQGKIISK